MNESVILLSSVEPPQIDAVSKKLSATKLRTDSFASKAGESAATASTTTYLLSLSSYSKTGGDKKKTPHKQAPSVAYPEKNSKQYDVNPVKSPVVGIACKELNNDSFRKDTKKVGHKALAGMIAQIMVSTLGEDDETSNKSTNGNYKVEQELPALPVLVKKGISISKSGLRFSSESLRSDSSVSRMSLKPPKVPRRRGSNTIKEVIDVVGELPFLEATLGPVTVPRPLESEPSRGMGRSSSATTYTDEEFKIRSPTRRLPQRSVSDKSYIQDLQPLKPARRRSKDGMANLEPQNLIDHTILEGSQSVQSRPSRAVLRPSRGSDGSGSGSNGLSVDEIESYVMARIPSYLKDKLPPEAWRSIFSAAAESQGSKSFDSRGSSFSSGTVLIDRTSKEHRPQAGSRNRSESSCFVAEMASPNGMYCDDDGSSVFSGVTMASGLGSKITDCSSPRSPAALPAADISRQIDPATLPPPSIPNARSWHDLSASVHAPRVPSRPEMLNERRGSEPPMGVNRYETRIPEYNRRSSDTMLMSSKKKSEVRVSFTSVHIRDYERVLDVNPSTSSGPSVGLGWSYVEYTPIAIDDLEGPRRSPRDLILPRRVRESLVRDLGYSDRDIASAVRRSLKVKHQRKQTYNNLAHQKIEYLVEKSRRKVRRLLRFAKKKHNPMDLSQQ